MMNLMSKITLNGRKKRLGLLKDNYAFSEDKNRIELTEFVCSDEKMDGIDINGSFGSLDGTILAIAVHNDDFEFFQLLLKQKASLASGMEELTLGQIASTSVKNVEFMAFLLRSNIDIFSKIDSRRMMPLDVRVQAVATMETENRSPDEVTQANKAIEYFVVSGGDPNVNYPKTISPLMRSCKLGLVGTTSILLKNGANPNQKYVLDDFDREQDCLSYLKWFEEKNPKTRNSEAIWRLLRSQA